MNTTSTRAIKHLTASAAWSGFRLLVAASLLLAPAGCAPGTPAGGSGGSGSGGSGGSGGSAGRSGGTGSGGAASTGGMPGSGGTSATGGASVGSGGAGGNTGGASSGGRGSGGATASGGATPPATGGRGAAAVSHRQGLEAGEVPERQPGESLGPRAAAGRRCARPESSSSARTSRRPRSGRPRRLDQTRRCDRAVDAAARGTHALKIGAATNGERRIYTDASKLGSGHWGRIFYRVQLPAAVPPSGNVLHSTLVGFQGNGPRNGNSEYRVVDTVEDAAGKHQFLWNVQPASVAEFGKGSPYNWMYDGKWHCAEWHVDGPTQSYHFYIDGAEVTQIAIDNGAGNYNGSEIPPSFSEIRAGLYNYQKACSPYLTVWIDEIALDTTRVGCGN